MSKPVASEASRELFLATPMSSLDSPEERLRLQRKAQGFAKYVSLTIPGVRIHCELLECADGEAYDSPEVAVREDFGAIAQSTHFILAYPCPLATSALLELGYAMASGKPCLIYGRSVAELPYLARPIGEPPLVEFLPYEEFGEESEALKRFLEC